MPANTTLTKKIWVAIILLAFAGQLAWGVENQFFNTFMYNNITPDPRPSHGWWLHLLSQPH
jgi:hypothetical protein